jgi:hypothetical protein
MCVCVACCLFDVRRAVLPRESMHIALPGYFIINSIPTVNFPASQLKHEIDVGDSACVCSSKFLRVAYKECMMMMM